jgi:signal transduction histidine kinase
MKQNVCRTYQVKKMKDIVVPVVDALIGAPDIDLHTFFRRYFAVSNTCTVSPPITVCRVDLAIMAIRSMG